MFAHLDSPQGLLGESTRKLIESVDPILAAEDLLLALRQEVLARHGLQ